MGKEVLRTIFGGKRTENGWRRGLNEEVMDTYKEQVSEKLMAGTHRKTPEKRTGEENIAKETYRKKGRPNKGI